MTAIDFAAFVDQLAAVSGDAILPFFRTSLSVEDKSRGGSFDPVTAADRAAEAAMRTLIRRTFPDHGVVGEEYGSERADAEYVWVLDPIDGTKSFIAGMPVWGTLIGLTRLGQPVFGMVHQPFMRERFTGDGGGGALSRAGGRARTPGAPMREPCRCGAVHDEPAADERRRSTRVRPGRRCGAALTLWRAIVTPIAWSQPAMPIS